MDDVHRIDVTLGLEDAARLRRRVADLRSRPGEHLRIHHVEASHHLADRCRMRLWLTCNGSVEDPEQEVRRLLERSPRS